MICAWGICSVGTDHMVIVLFILCFALFLFQFVPFVPWRYFFSFLPFSLLSWKLFLCQMCQLFTMKLKKLKGQGPPQPLVSESYEHLTMNACGSPDTVLTLFLTFYSLVNSNWWNLAYLQLAILFLWLTFACFFVFAFSFYVICIFFLQIILGNVPFIMILRLLVHLYYPIWKFDNQYASSKETSFVLPIFFDKFSRIP